MRELGHDFVARELDEEQLVELARYVESMSALINHGELRQRQFSEDRFAQMSSLVPRDGDGAPIQLTSDSMISGGANPMGLGTHIRREGDVAVMELTLGTAFEGPPGRAHGGAVAALFDEAMGLVNMLNREPAYTVQLNISYISATPLNELITARAWLARREGRKLFVEATLSAREKVCATATALFIAMDLQVFSDVGPVDES